MSAEVINSLKDVDDITSILEVMHTHTIKCTVDLGKKEVQIPRLELRLRGNRSIAAGWTARIAMVQGIDRRFTIRDGMVLPTIAPNALGAVEGGTATIPNDFVNSQDGWSFEWYVVDPSGESALLYRSPIASFSG